MLLSKKRNKKTIKNKEKLEKTKSVSKNEWCQKKDNQRK